MMIKTLRDLLTAYWKEQTKAKIKLRKNKLLIYDDYLNKYVSADELLVPGEIKQEKANGSIKLKIPKEFLLFELLLNKFVNPKLDLLTSGATKHERQLSTICDFKIKHKNFTTSSIDYFLRKKQDCKDHHVPALPPVHELNTEIEHSNSTGIGWAGQVTKKPLTDPRPEINNSSCAPDGDKGQDKKRPPKKKEKDLREKLVCGKVSSKTNYNKDTAKKGISTEEYTELDKKSTQSLSNSKVLDGGKDEKENFTCTKNRRKKSKERKKSVFKKLCSQLFSQEKVLKKECSKERGESENVDLSKNQTQQNEEKSCDKLTISKSCEKTLTQPNENMSVFKKKGQKRSKSVSFNDSSNVQIKIESEKPIAENENFVCKKTVQTTCENKLSGKKTQSSNCQHDKVHSIVKSKYNFMVTPKVLKFKGKFLRTLNFNTEKDRESKTISEECASKSSECNEKKEVNSDITSTNLNEDFITQTPKEICTLTNVVCTKSEKDINQNKKTLGTIKGGDIKAKKEEKKEGVKKICRIEKPICQSAVKVNMSEESVFKEKKSVSLKTDLTIDECSRKNEMQIKKKEKNVCKIKNEISGSEKTHVKCVQSLPELTKSIKSEINYCKDRKQSVECSSSLPEINISCHNKRNKEQKSTNTLNYKPKKGLEFGLSKHGNLENKVCKSKVLDEDKTIRKDEELRCQHVEPKVTEKLQIMAQEKCFEEASRDSDLSKTKSGTYMGFKINKQCSDTKQEKQISQKSSKTKCSKQSKKTSTPASTTCKQHTNELKISPSIKDFSKATKSKENLKPSKSKRTCTKVKKSKENLKSSKSKESLSKHPTKRVNSKEKYDKVRKVTNDMCKTDNASDKQQSEQKDIGSSCNKQKKEVFDTNCQGNYLPQQSFSETEKTKNVCNTQNLEIEKQSSKEQYLNKSADPCAVTENKSGIENDLSQNICSETNAINEIIDSSNKCEDLKKEADNKDSSVKEDNVCSSSAVIEHKENENIKQRLPHKEKKSLSHSDIGEEMHNSSDKETTCTKGNQKDLSKNKSDSIVSSKQIKPKLSNSSKKLKKKKTDFTITTSKVKKLKRIKGCKSTVKSWKKTAAKQRKKSKREKICTNKKSKTSIKQSNSRLKTHSKRAVKDNNEKSAHSIKSSSNVRSKRVVNSSNKSKLSIQGIKSTEQMKGGRRAVVCSKSTPNLTTMNKPSKPQSLKSASIKTNVKLTEINMSSTIPKNSKTKVVKKTGSNKGLKGSKSKKICSLQMLQSSVSENPEKSLKQIGMKSYSQLKTVSNPQINNLATTIRKTSIGLYGDKINDSSIKEKLSNEQKKTLVNNTIGKSSYTKTLIGTISTNQTNQYQELCNMSKYKITPKTSNIKVTKVKNLYTVQNSLPDKDEKFNLIKNRNRTISSDSAVRTINTGNTTKHNSKYHDPNASKGNLSNKNNFVLEEKTDFGKDSIKPENKSEPSTGINNVGHVNKKGKQVTLSTVIKRHTGRNRYKGGRRNKRSINEQLFLEHIQENPKRAEVIKKEINNPIQSLNANDSKTISNQELLQSHYKHPVNEDHSTEDKVKKVNDTAFTEKSKVPTDLNLDSVSKDKAESTVTNNVNVNKAVLSNYTTQVHLQHNLDSKSVKSDKSSVRKIQIKKKRKRSAPKKTYNSFSQEKLNKTNNQDNIYPTDPIVGKNRVQTHTQITHKNSTKLTKIKGRHIAEKEAILQSIPDKWIQNGNEKNITINNTALDKNEIFLKQNSRKHTSKETIKLENTSHNKETAPISLVNQSKPNTIQNNQLKYINARDCETSVGKNKENVNETNNKLDVTNQKKIECAIDQTNTTNINKDAEQKLNEFIPKKSNKKHTEQNGIAPNKVITMQISKNDKMITNKTQASKTLLQTVEGFVPDKTKEVAEGKVKGFIQNTSETKISKASNETAKKFDGSSKKNKAANQNIKDLIPGKITKIQISKASDQIIKNVVSNKTNQGADKKMGEFIPGKISETHASKASDHTPKLVTGKTDESEDKKMKELNNKAKSQANKAPAQTGKSSNQTVEDSIPNKVDKGVDKTMEFIPDKVNKTQNIKAFDQTVKYFLPNKIHKATNKDGKESVANKKSNTQISKAKTLEVKDSNYSKIHQATDQKLRGPDKKIEIQIIKAAGQEVKDSISNNMHNAANQKVTEFCPDKRREAQITTASDQKEKDFIPDMTNKVEDKKMVKHISDKIIKTGISKTLHENVKEFIPNKTHKSLDKKPKDFVSNKRSETQRIKTPEKKVNVFIHNKSNKVAKQTEKQDVSNTESKIPLNKPSCQKMKDFISDNTNKVANQKLDDRVSDKVTKTSVSKDAFKKIKDIGPDKTSKTQIIKIKASDQKVNDLVSNMTNTVADEQVKNVVSHKRSKTLPRKPIFYKVEDNISYKSSNVTGPKVHEIIPGKTNQTQITNVSDQRVGESIPDMTNKDADQTVKKIVPHKRSRAQSSKPSYQKVKDLIPDMKNKVADDKQEKDVSDKIIVKKQASKGSHTKLEHFGLAKTSETEIIQPSEINGSISNLTNEVGKEVRDFVRNERSKTQTSQAPYKKIKDVSCKSSKTTNQKLNEGIPDKISKVSHKRSKTKTSKASLKTVKDFIPNVRKRTQVVKPAEKKTETSKDLKHLTNKKEKSTESITQKVLKSVKSQKDLFIGKRIVKKKKMNKHTLVSDKEINKVAQVSPSHFSIPLKSASKQDVIISKSVVESSNLQKNIKNGEGITQHNKNNVDNKQDEHEKKVLTVVKNKIQKRTQKNQGDDPSERQSFSKQTLTSKKSIIKNKKLPNKTIPENNKINETILKNKLNSKGKIVAQIKKPSSSPATESVNKKSSTKPERHLLRNHFSSENINLRKTDKEMSTSKEQT